MVCCELDLVSAFRGRILENNLILAFLMTGVSVWDGAIQGRP